MPIIEVKGTQETDRPEKMRSQKTSRVVNIGRQLPTERQSVASEIPAGPLEAEERLT